MERKTINAAEFRALLTNNISIMFGGLKGVGTPQFLINEILHAGVKNLTLIGNDVGFINSGISVLINNRQVKKIIISQISSNPDISQYMLTGELEIELVPQSTLSERIHCGGSGFGGFLTPTGVGSFLEQGKQKVELNDITYLIELPLRADLAIVQADIADSSGNLSYKPQARNLNPLIACAADMVVAQCNHIVTPGELKPESVMTSGAFVDYLFCRSKIEPQAKKKLSFFSYHNKPIQ